VAERGKKESEAFELVVCGFKSGVVSGGSGGLEKVVDDEAAGVEGRQYRFAEVWLVFGAIMKEGFDRKDAAG